MTAYLKEASEVAGGCGDGWFCSILTAKAVLVAASTAGVSNGSLYTGVRSE